MSQGEIRFGESLPVLHTGIPGPRSQALAQRLAHVESPNITRLEPAPIFWAAAHGANVRDVDGNVFVDLTAGFGVASAGHSNPAVTAAISAQAAELAHGLGDVQPSAVKVALLERLAAISPDSLDVGILGSAGAEAVEAALKTAWLRTRRPVTVAFEGAYHGLTLGALAVTHREEFRAPFEPLVKADVRFAPFPTGTADLPAALLTLDSLLDDSVGTILVEPIQGRGGIRVPPPGFLPALRQRCDGHHRVLVFDEIYTGIGRTGRWFACEHVNVVPDLLLVGKGITGSIALSACLGTREVMSAWPPSTGEAIHTSTFLGNPIACAAALAQINVIEERGLMRRATEIGDRISQRARKWCEQFRAVVETRGLGAIQAVALGAADRASAPRICELALQRGIILLPEGPASNVLALTPPLVISDGQLDHALNVVEAALGDCLF
jgi:4-aminobutyrate aminotransferase-like enzyme